MDIHDAYTLWADTYDQDRNLTRDLDQIVTRQALSGRRYASILEIGCGTGKNTLFLAGLGERVLGLDFSAGMLALARQKVDASRVFFAVADLTRPWPCRERSIDLIACNLVLEHIQDLDFIFGQAARALRPGGLLFVCELHPFRQYQGTQANFQAASRAVTIPAFVHHLSDFTGAAEGQGLALIRLDEWWHAEDQGQPPRLLSMMIQKL